MDWQPQRHILHPLSGLLRLTGSYHTQDLGQMLPGPGESAMAATHPQHIRLDVLQVILCVPSSSSFLNSPAVPPGTSYLPCSPMLLSSYRGEIESKGTQFFQRIGMVDFLVNIRVHAVFRRKRHACQLRLKINHPVKRLSPSACVYPALWSIPLTSFLLFFHNGGAILCTVLIFRSISQEKPSVHTPTT